MCNLEPQGYEQGSCLTCIDQNMEAACKSTLKEEEHTLYRLIKSAHLSRPEHYFSVYQSGCTLTCRNCHSHEFSQKATGRWISPQRVLELAKRYELLVTYIEERERVTAYHGIELCKSCGSCITDVRHASCPHQVDPTQIILSPQGWGPARNIIGFTGGDITCCPEFYAQCAKLIKRETNLYVLIETNGYGLTFENLKILKRAGVDSFWLDIKAFDDKIHRELTGVSNEWILQVPQHIKDHGFVLEVSTLYIPTWIETDQIARIAELIAAVDVKIAFTILAYSPAYKMTTRSPTLSEIASAYDAAKTVGLQDVRMGNLGVVSQEGADQL